MESAQNLRARVPGLLSMAIAIVVFSSVFWDWTVPYWFIALVVAMALGIVAVINGGPGSEYGIVGLAVGLPTMVLLLLGISF